jgi:hypothetical protein
MRGKGTRNVRLILATAVCCSVAFAQVERTAITGTVADE